MALTKSRVKDGKYPLINNKGVVRMFGAKPNHNFGGQSMVESMLANIEAVSRLSDKERLKVGNARMWMDGWRDMADNEYQEWIEFKMPYRLDQNVSGIKEAFETQIEEKDAAIAKLKKDLAEAQKKTKPEVVNG